VPDFVEGTLTFRFPAGWQIRKHDDSSFYKSHFQAIADSKSVDLVAYNPNDEAIWLVEVKDYRGNPREKDLDIFAEVAKKVRDTLASLFVAQRRPEVDLYQFARGTRGKRTIRVVLHLEQPAKPSKLYPVVVERANARLKLIQAVRVADPHALFCEVQAMPVACPWTVF
jgi:hypothetical protein